MVSVEVVAVSGAFFLATIVVVFWLVRYSNRCLKERLDALEQQVSMISGISSKGLKDVLRHSKEVHEKLERMKEDISRMEKVHETRLVLAKKR